MPREMRVQLMLYVWIAVVGVLVATIVPLILILTQQPAPSIFDGSTNGDLFSAHLKNAMNVAQTAKYISYIRIGGLATALFSALYAFAIWTKWFIRPAQID